MSFRAGWLLAAVMLAVGAAPITATAQSTGFEESLPVRTAIDANGVNVIDGTFHAGQSSISVGTSGGGED